MEKFCDQWSVQGSYTSYHGPGHRYNLIPASASLFDTIIWFFGLEHGCNWETEGEIDAELNQQGEAPTQWLWNSSQGGNFSFPLNPEVSLFFRNVTFRNDKIEPLSLSIRMANMMVNSCCGGEFVLWANSTLLYSYTHFVKYLNTV